MLTAAAAAQCNVSKDTLHAPLKKVWTGEGMLQEMHESWAKRHASADAMLHALVDEKRHRLNTPLLIPREIGDHIPMLANL
jgi:hypothetical protein